MSQSGILKLADAILPPDVPTSFVTNVGTAVPIGNVLDILGSAIAASSTPVITTGIGNTVTIEVQRASTSVSSSALKAGLASFDSSSFTVDGNGFVTFSGTSTPITFAADVGTATAALSIIKFTGNSTQGISSSASGNTVNYTIADASSIQKGVASFNGTQFTVAAGSVTSNNFTITAGTGLSGGGTLTLGGSVTLSAGPTIATTYTANSGTATPAANNLNIFGAAIAAGSTPVSTAAAGSTVTVNVQTAQAIAATDATKIGLASFNSADFSVDANGFVTFTGGGSSITINGDSGSATGSTFKIGTYGAGGSSVNFQITGTDIELNISDGGNNTIIGSTAGNGTLSGSRNTTVGVSSLLALTSGNDNTSLGYSALLHLTSGINNVGIGKSVLTSITNGGYNIAIGFQAAGGYTGAESSNITIGASGTTGESNVIRIGTQGATAGLQNTCFIAGIVGVTASNSELVTINSSTGQLGVLANVNSATLVSSSTGVPTYTGTMTNGQVVIGSTGATPAAAVLTPGSGITITNAAASITIAQTNPSGFPWTNVTGATQTLAINNGYITNHSTTVVYTLPSTAALGDTIKIVGKLGLATVTPNANQQVLSGSTSGTVGVTGTLVSNNVGDCVTLICTTSGSSTVWRVDSMMGTWTLT